MTGSADAHGFGVVRGPYALFRQLEAHYGPTGWWPADSPFEIAVGAILVQNTAWTNVERAIARMKDLALLHPARILESDHGYLENAIRSSGFFRVKAERLRHFCTFLVERHDGRMERMAEVGTDDLRRDLLAVHGIGPETADDILLYACDRPVFVVDAYTRRVFSRHGLVPADIGYEALRTYCEAQLPADLRVYQEFHGLLVLAAKDFCRKTARCEECPLDTSKGFFGASERANPF